MKDRFVLKTLNDVLAKATSHGDKQVMLYQPASAEKGAAWQAITSTQLYGKVRALAQVFAGWGVGKGDRVAILAENRWEWAATDFAALALGAADVPLYSTNTAEQVGYMLRDSGAKVAVLSTADQWKKLCECGELPALERVVVMDDGEHGNAESFSALLQGAAQLEARDAEFDARCAEVQPDDLATIIYTSGTTGEPKGVKLTHGNIASNLNVTTWPFDFHSDDSCISFLPLSHVTARHVDYALLCHGARLAHLPNFNLLPDALKATRPTIFVGVPRVYEKIRQGVEGKANHSPVSARVFAWALSVGRAHREETLAGRTPTALYWELADKLVLGKIRAAFGGCVHTFISGGAPLGFDLGAWFADVGIRIFEGYGMTETSPVISLNYPQAYRLGTTGKVIENVEVRFAPDGELEVRGPSVFHGYWNKDEETRKEFTEDGWFKTGDIGKLEDGFLSITDRKKELLKTSGGKLIAPQPIENKLKTNGLVAQAAMVGDKHKFACVLISPNFDALTKWAAGQGVATGDHAALVADGKVVAEYQRIVDAVNKDLPHYETMKRMHVVPDEWTLESGELTPSMKLKRRVLAEKYEKEIADFYADEADAKE